MSETILEMKHISKSFSGVEVLHDVSFSLRRGEIHALLGENGAGKSTLVKIITGYLQPNKGECYLEGNLVEINNTSESSQLGIAAIYQELSLFPDLDVAENIFIGRQPITKFGNVDWRKLYKQARDLLDSLGIQLDLRKKARNLSIAQQQIVEIARAFSINAKILIMDEPTSSLTLNEVADLFRIVRSLRDRGTSIIFISHRLEELFELVDRVTVLRDGSYVDTCLINEVDRDDLIRMMVGRRISNQFPKQSIPFGDVVLKVENLTLDGVFKDINFEVREGEILGLSGLVGAGRTNVACAIFGVTPATRGKIFIDGREVEINSTEQAMALGISYVPEDRQKQGLIPAMNIISNISLPMLDDYSAFGWIKNKVEVRSTYEAACQMQVRANSMWQLAKELSGGNQQKVVLAKWLSMKPRLLILDEPTRGIDVGTKAVVHGLMSELAAKEGLAILMISSELPEILGMSDRIIVMHEGQQTGVFDRAEATQEKILSAATLNTRQESEN